VVEPGVEATLIRAGGAGTGCPAVSPARDAWAKQPAATTAARAPASGIAQFGTLMTGKTPPR
jgi:hypothetical protein